MKIRAKRRGSSRMRKDKHEIAPTMMTINRLSVLLLIGLMILAPVASARQLPESDRRLTEIRHLDLAYEFPEYRTREGWLARAEYLRKQILASAGLWPMPARPPIEAKIFGKVDRGDFTVEKVFFESYPGFYVTGNLYRPKNVTGRLPAVLSPHGHWTYGRLENTPLNSGPTRAANLARQGYVAFSYDMVGYNDSSTISHRFAIGHREGFDRETLWSVNLLGLQLWNSIRSLDFLTSLPEVDPERIACTGESGGGTQTFLLMAVDERIKVASPVNMISFIMQGGSLCENAPNLRIDTNNVEIGATMAPRPMLMVSATGDWTKNTMTSEYPAIRGIYRLFGAEDKIAAVQMNAPHNYNQESREAVYGWFAHWLLGRPETGPVKEKGGAVSPITDLMVFYSRSRPDHEFDEAQLSRSMIEMAKNQLAEMQPQTSSGIDRFREQFGTTLKYSLMAELPGPDEIVTGRATNLVLPDAGFKAVNTEILAISRKGRGDLVAVALLQPQKKKTDAINLVIDPDTRAGQFGGPATDLAQMLIKAGHAVLLVKTFPGGRQVPDQYKFFTTYNRTDQALRVQDILTALAFAGTRFSGARLNVIAPGQAGLWALLARGLAPKIDRMVVDASEFDSSNDQDYIKSLPIPGLRRAGDFATAVAVSPLTPLLIHNTGDKFRIETIADIYKRLGRSADFKSQPSAINGPALEAWLSSR